MDNSVCNSGSIEEFYDEIANSIIDIDKKIKMMMEERDRLLSVINRRQTSDIVDREESQEEIHAKKERENYHIQFLETESVIDFKGELQPKKTLKNKFMEKLCFKLQASKNWSYGIFVKMKDYFAIPSKMAQLRLYAKFYHRPRIKTGHQLKRGEKDKHTVDVTLFLIEILREILVFHATFH